MERPYQTEELETAEGTVLVLSPEEAWKRFDTQARKRLNMSGREFIQRWHAGEFAGEDENLQATYLAMIMPSQAACNGGQKSF